jgi:hypothetical protein
MALVRYHVADHSREATLASPCSAQCFVFLYVPTAGVTPAALGEATYQGRLGCWIGSFALCWLDPH